MPPAYTVGKANEQHAQNPEGGNRCKEKKGDDAGFQNKAGDHLVNAKAAERGHQQREVFPALGIAPKAVICVEKELEDHRADVEQDHVRKKLSPSHRVRQGIAEGKSGKYQGHAD